MKAVNLLPEDSRRGRPAYATGKTPFVALGAILLVGGLGYWAYDVRQDVSRLDSDIAAATAERDSLEAQLGAYRAARERYAAQDVKRGTVVSLTSGRVNWERVIRGVAAVMPSTVWLDTVRAEAPDAATLSAAAATTTPGGTLTTPKGLHLEGYAYTQPQVAQLMARIRVVPGLGPAQLTQSEVESRGGRKVVRFVIDAPIDKRAQDRATLQPVPQATTPGLADPAAGGTAPAGQGGTL